MARKHDPDQLRRVAMVCDVKTTAAKLDAARAARDAAQSAAELQQSKARRGATEDGWRAAIESPPIATDRIALWSSALRRSEREVMQASRDALAAEQELASRSAAFHASSKRGEIVHDLVAQSQRDARTKRDESAMQQSLDMISQRKAVE